MAENAVYLIAGTILIGLFVWFVIFAESAFTPVKEKRRNMDSNRERTSTPVTVAATVHDASTNIAATVDAYATLAAYLRSHKFDMLCRRLESLPLDACLSQDRPALLESPRPAAPH